MGVCDRVFGVETRDAPLPIVVYSDTFGAIFTHPSDPWLDIYRSSSSDFEVVTRAMPSWLATRLRARSQDGNHGAPRTLRDVVEVPAAGSSGQPGPERGLDANRGG